MNILYIYREFLYKNMIIQRRISKAIKDSLSFFPVVCIIGPRQVGKTTLAKMLLKEWETPSIYLDLELYSDLSKLNNAELFLSGYKDKLVVIDEVQNKKDLFPQLRALVDQNRTPGQFLLLGSASPELIRNSSETLAGRIAYHQLSPFDISEIPDSISQNKLWINGGFPDALNAPNNNLWQRWMDNFIRTYLNRDLLQLGLNASPTTIRNLWTMMAHLNGQLFKASILANSLGITNPTVKRYVDFLEEAFLIKRLYPFSWNMKKRLVKSPKIYLTDTGILHYLHRINDFESLSGNPVIGNSWESFVINQIFAFKKPEYDMYFYRTHNGAEADLVFTKGVHVVGVAEIKYSNSPHLTKGNFIAFDDLQAPMNFVITPSSDDFLVRENVRICQLKYFIFNYLPFL